MSCLYPVVRELLKEIRIALSNTNAPIEILFINLSSLLPDNTEKDILRRAGIKRVKMDLRQPVWRSTPIFRPLASRESEEDWMVSRPSNHFTQQLRGRRIKPMHILYEDDKTSLFGHRIDQVEERLLHAGIHELGVPIARPAFANRWLVFRKSIQITESLRRAANRTTHRSQSRHQIDECGQRAVPVIGSALHPLRRNPLQRCKCCELGEQPSLTYAGVAPHQA